MEEERMAIFLNGQLHPVIKKVPITAQLVPLRARVYGTITTKRNERKIYGTWYPRKGLTVALEGGSNGVHITLQPDDLEGKYFTYTIPVPVAREEPIKKDRNPTTSNRAAATAAATIFFTIVGRVLSLIRALGY